MIGRLKANNHRASGNSGDTRIASTPANIAAADFHMAWPQIMDNGRRPLATTYI